MIRRVREAKRLLWVAVDEIVNQKYLRLVKCAARTRSHRGAMTRSGSDIMHFGGGSCTASVVFVITQAGLVNKWQPQFTGRWRPQCVDSALEPNLTLKPPLRQLSH